MAKENFYEPDDEAARTLAARGKEALDWAWATGDDASLEAAVTLLHRACSALAPDLSARIGVLDTLGVALRHRFERTGRTEDLKEAVEVLRRAVNAAPQDHPDRPGYLSDLGTALGSQFWRTGRIQDLDEAIEMLRQAVKTAPQGHPNRFEYLVNLGTALGSRFEDTSRLEDLGEAIGLTRQAIDATPQDHPDRPGYLTNLGALLMRRFGQTDRIEDMDEAIDLTRKAIADIPPNRPDRPRTLSNLERALLRRFERTGRIQDLDEAVEVLRQVISSIPENHADRPRRMSKLAAALRDRFERVGRVEDLDETIEVYRRVVEATPQDHPDCPGYLSNLGTALGARYEHTGRLEDLEKAVEVLRQTVKITPQNRGDLLSLGNALGLRYRRTGRLEDLDEAIDITRQAAKTLPQDAPYRHGYLTNLGVFLQRRFDRTGRQEDLVEATDLARQAVDIIPQINPHRPGYLSNLGTVLQRRFDRTGSLEDLNEAVTWFREAVRSVPKSHAYLPMFQVNLGNALTSRSECTGRLEDLDEAIDITRQAIDATPQNRPSHPIYLANLAADLGVRFQHTGRPEDLDEAIDVCRKAVASVPKGHPDQPRVLSNLGVDLWIRFEQSGRVEDLEEAIGLFREGAGVVSAPVDVRVRAARQWGWSAAAGGWWAEAVEGYGAAVELAALVASRELARGDQEHRAGLLTGLGTAATAACLQAGQPGRAVEMFEHGRALLFSQTLETRSDLTALAEKHPDLAERFARWRDELERRAPDPTGLSAGLPVGFLTAGAGKGETGEAAARAAVRVEAERRGQAAAELARVLEEIRARPGFNRFLKPRPATELLPAAAKGPVVLLNVAELRSDALILTPDGIEVLPMEGVDPTAVAGQVEVFLEALEESAHPSQEVRDLSEEILASVLGWLGERITGPVLDHLGHTTTPPLGSSWPRVWWCPSGVLTLLPLHAAGHHRSESSGASGAVIDRVISSTTPTLRALLRARDTPPLPGEQQKMLVVAMPHTPHQSDLPGAGWEATTLRSLYPGKATVLGLPGTDPATYDTVLAALPGHPLVHFACHGESDLANPSASHLLLADYQAHPLTVLDLTAARLPGAELAFLSACTTARTGATLPDEPIHLAAACQLAGYRHVIASLWPIGDTETAWLTKRFYTTYTTTNDTPDAAQAPEAPATTLHHTTRELRSHYPDHPSLWAPYTHTGP